MAWPKSFVHDLPACRFLRRQLLHPSRIMPRTKCTLSRPSSIMHKGSFTRNDQHRSNARFKRPGSKLGWKAKGAGFKRRGCSCGV